MVAIAKALRPQEEGAEQKGCFMQMVVQALPTFPQTHLYP
jgi:hypothetical protein